MKEQSGTSEDWPICSVTISIKLLLTYHLLYSQFCITIYSNFKVVWFLRFVRKTLTES
jgi:hypothetical protein